MLAIIPARGGSKGLPRKNILPLLEKPLIGYTIDAALKSDFVSRVIVSTDDSEIAEIASRLGAEIPFMRPVELAQDASSAIDVYVYTIDRLQEQAKTAIHEFMVLQPTSPLRTCEDIDRAVEIFRDTQADSVISVTESAHPPVWAKKISPEGILTEYFPEYASNKNRQEIESAYMPNGAIFIFKYALLKEFRHYYSDKTYPYIMPARRSVDIDTQLDFDFAEFLLRQE